MENTVATTEAPAVSSFLSRATNVYASPSELYVEVAASPVQRSSWLIPFLICLVLGLLFTYALYNNPALRQQVYDMQERAMKEQVAAGKMTAQQYDQITSGMESSGPTLFMLIGGGGALLTITAMFFGISLLLWIIARLAFKSPAGYMKFVEMYGLTSFVGILGTIITLLMMNLMNSMYATPSIAALYVSSFDPTRVADRFASSANIFTIWEVALLGLGFGKIAGKSTALGLGISFGIWIVWVVASSAMGWGMR